MESLRETNRRLKNKIISLKTSAKGNKSKMNLMRRRGKTHNFCNLLLSVLHKEALLYFYAYII